MIQRRRKGLLLYLSRLFFRSFHVQTHASLSLTCGGNTISMPPYADNFCMCLDPGITVHIYIPSPTLPSLARGLLLFCISIPPLLPIRISVTNSLQTSDLLRESKAAANVWLSAALPPPVPPHSTKTHKYQYQ